MKIGELLRGGGVLGPVPVRLVALVRALLPESPLVVEDEPSMPRLEVAGVVDFEASFWMCRALKSAY